MAITQELPVTDTWTPFPEAEQFLFQNISSPEIRVAVSDVTPTVRGHILMRGESTNRLSDEKHWHRSTSPAMAEFTPQ